MLAACRLAGLSALGAHYGGGERTHAIRQSGEESLELRAGALIAVCSLLTWSGRFTITRNWRWRS